MFRFVNVRFKRYWFIVDSICGFLMIVVYMMIFLVIFKRQMMIKIKIVKLIGSVMYLFELFVMVLVFVFNEVLFDIFFWCLFDFGKEC